MKINSVKDFVRINISKFKKDKNTTGLNRIFNLYDKNNSYRGEYFFKALSRSGYNGVGKSISVTRLMDDSLNQTMQEIVYMKKDCITVKDKSSDILLKVLPSEITIIRTVLDFVNDKFLTIRSVSKLRNQLQRIEKNDPDFIYKDNFVIYEPLKEKPQYKKKYEILREGKISETQKNNLLIPNNRENSRLGCTHQIPYRFW